MVSGSIWLLLLGMLAMMANCLSTTLMEDVQRADQAMRPKAKRAQELLMFGNQQNRQAEIAAANLFEPTAEKRTLGSSGLEEAEAAFPTTDKFSHAKPLAASSIFERKTLSPYDKSYQYSKVLDNQIAENAARTWDIPPYPRYYSINDDRRKRSDNAPSSTHAPTSTTTAPAPQVTRSTQQPIAQAKRSLPAYQEPRYKRDVDAEDVLTLLSLWEAERRNRNWPGYETEQYDNVDDDGNLVDVEEEDPRNGGSWLEGPVYPPHHYSVLGSDVLAPSDIGIPRTHPAKYYEQFGNQYGQQYGGAQYGAPQYGAAYPQQSYYPPEKRFMVSRKRSQGYGSYSGNNDILSLAQLLGSQPRGYSSYPHRLVY